MSWSAKLRLSALKMTYAGANAMLFGLRRVLWPIRPARKPDSICLYRIGNVGDTVCALPAMRAVRRAYPAARLVLLTSPGHANMPGARDVLEGNDWLDDVIVYRDTDIATWAGRWRLLRRLRQERVDLWIELPNVRASIGRLMRNMLFARLSGARWGGGWRLSTVRLWPRLQSDFLQFPNEVQRLLAILCEEGVDGGEVEYGYARQPEISAAAAYILARAGIENARPLVAIATGAKRTTNRWFSERWIDVGRALAASDHELVLVGGPGEIELCKKIAEGIGPAAVTMAGQTTLPVLAEVLARCSLALCVDSGVQHIAAAVGTPCVSLVAARDYRGKWHPHGTHIVIEKRVPCHTCLLERCPNDNLCMREITVAEVVAAAMQLLRQSRTMTGGRHSLPTSAKAILK